MEMEGLWSVRFGANGSEVVYGVAVFVGDRILGGDAAFYWVGTYNRSIEDQASVTIEARSHSGLPVRNIFGQLTKSYSIELTAFVSPNPPVGKTIRAVGPQGFVAQLTKRA
jgi:hypothetical protein